MITYLLKRYFFIATTIAIILTVTFFLAGMEKFVLKSFVWAGFVAVYVTHIFFERQNLWIFYKNMQFSEMPLLFLCLVSFEVISIFSIAYLSKVLS